MTHTRTRPLDRIWGVSTGLAGAVTVLAPSRAAEMLSGPTPPPTWVVRVLGGRELVQGIVLVVRPTRRVAQLFVAVDAIHLVTMVAAWWIFPQFRRSEAVSGSAALGSALLGLVVLRRHR